MKTPGRMYRQLHRVIGLSATTNDDTICIQVDRDISYQSMRATNERLAEVVEPFVVEIPRLALHRYLPCGPWVMNGLDHGTQDDRDHEQQQ